MKLHLGIIVLCALFSCIFAQQTNNQGIQRIPIKNGVQNFTVSIDSPITTADFINGTLFPIVEPTQRLKYGLDDQQYADLYVPARGNGSFAVVVLVHGGCFLEELGADKLDLLALDFVAHGYAVWNIEYRRVNSSGGFPNTWHDVGDALDYLRHLQSSYSLDLNQIVVVGHDVGGSLALYLARRPSIQVNSLLYAPDPLPVLGVVTLAGTNDLASFQPAAESFDTGCSLIVANLLGGVPAAVPDVYAEVTGRVNTTQIWLFGDADINTPISYALEVYANTTQTVNPFPFLVLQNAAHFDFLEPFLPTNPFVRRAVTYVQQKSRRR